MVSSFKDFISSRQSKPLPPVRNPAPRYNPSGKGNVRTQLAYGGQQQPPAAPKKDIFQPNPKLPSFQDSDYYTSFEIKRDELNSNYEALIAAAPPGTNPMQFNREARLNEKRINDAEEDFKKQYAGWVKQTTATTEAAFKGLDDEAFDPNQEDSSSFVLREKTRYDEGVRQNNESLPLSDRGQIGSEEAEFRFYDSLLQNNNLQSVLTSPKIINGEAVTDWEEKTEQARSQVMDMLDPIKVGGIQTTMRGYQEQAVKDATAGSRARKFVGKSVNPIGEDFLPVVAAQAVFGGAARAATEPFERAGIISPETGSKIETGAAFTGEVLGFGFGIGSVARSARWMADDVMLPYKVLRGAKNWATKQYGQAGFRTSKQLVKATTNPGTAPPSLSLTDSEQVANGVNPLEYNAQAVGALNRPATDIRIVETPGKPTKISATFKGEGSSSGSTTWFTINGFNDYYIASGKILGMSDEQTAQAARVAEPIIEGIAKLFGTTKDEYISSLLPTVRSAEMGSDSVARTLTGGAIGNPGGRMNKLFQRVASIIEYSKTNPDLQINQADAFISIQHELSHVILQDVFTHASYATTDGGVRLKALAESLKEQVILRQQLTGKPLSIEQLSVLNGLSPNDVARLVNLDPGGTARQSGKPLTWIDNNLIKELDLTELLHESGAELFSRYLIEVAQGGEGFFPASAVAKANTGAHALDAVWSGATNSLASAVKIFVNEHISKGTKALGVARQVTQGEQQTLAKFYKVLEDIAKQGEPSEFSISAVKAAAERKVLNAGEAKDVAIILARATADTEIERQMMATFYLEDKTNIISSSFTTVGFDVENLSTLTAGGLEIRSNSRMTPWGSIVHNDSHFDRVMSLVREMYPASEIKQMAELGLITDAKVALRRTLIVQASSPETKLLSLHDLSRPARSKLSIVDADGIPLAPLNNWGNSNLPPSIKKELGNLAFTNEAGEPIIFYTGVKVDYKADFKHALSNMFGNIAGIGKYGSTLDVAAWSYADEFYARVQAYIPLIHPEEVLSMELIGTADRLGAKFIDAGITNDVFVNTTKNKALKLAQEGMDFGPVRGRKELSYGIAELKNLQKPVDLTPVDVEKVFNTDVLSNLYDDFAEQLDIITREESYRATKLDINEQAILEHDGLSSIWDSILPASLEDSNNLGINAEDFIVIKAATRTVANKAKSFLEDAEKTGTATKAQREAVKRLLEQDEAFEALSSTRLEEINLRIEAATNAFDVPDSVYVDQKATMAAFEIAQAMVNGATNNWWQIVKSSSMNNIPVIAEINEVQTGSDLASYVIHRARNRHFVRNIHDTLDPANDYWLNVADEYTEIQATNRLNKMYTDNGVGAVTEVGGTATGGAPHRVLVMVGSDEVIKNKVLFVATDAKATEAEKVVFNRKNPQGGNLDNLTDKAELEVRETKHGRSLVESEQKLIDLNTDVIQRAIDQKVIATTRAVEAPARAVEERLDLLRKAIAGNVIPRQPNNPVPNLSPPKVNFRKYFGDGVAEPINARILEEVLGDTTGRFGRIDGNMTEEGEDYIATNLIPEIEKRINSEEFKVWRETTDAEISAARTATASRIESAGEARKASADPVRGFEIKGQAVGGAMKSQADASKSGYKPLRLHPMEVVALINHGERNLPNIKNAKLKKVLRTFDRTTYEKAIQKLLGVDTPFVGSAESIRLKTGTEPQRLVGGMAGTIQLDVAEVLTTSEVTLVWEALGLSAKGRDMPPQTKWQILRSLLIQALNAPRALLLSIDFGAIWNQGGLLIGGAVKPVTTRRSLSLLAKGDVKEWASGPDTQWYQNIAKSSVGMFTARNYDAQMKAITADANYSQLNKHVFISDLNGPLAQREEAFLGNLFNTVGNVLPDVVKNNAFMQKAGSVLKRPVGVVAYPFKAGERFHNLYLNKMRYDLLNDYYKTLQNSNVPEGAMGDYLASYGNFLNKATGRGSLPDNVGPALSTVLLAPRWMTSRFQVPFTVMKVFGKEAMQFKAVKFKETEKAGAALRKANAHAKKWDLPKSSVVKTDTGYVVNAGHRGAHTSKQMSADLARTFGVIGGITTLLVLNGFEVETDWRKSNFLKASKGRVNIDLTLGLGSVWRFMARAAYGRASGKEVTSMGDEFDADLTRQIANFTRAKLSPLGASGVGAVTDTNFFGEEITGREQFIPGQSTEIKDFYPLMIQQIMEASEQIDGGFAKTLLGIGAASGLNVSIYADKNDLSQELAGVDYKELYGYEQKYINRMYYEGSEFQPSEYTQTVYDIELEQYQKIETIMAGGQSKSRKAGSIYSLMNRYDAEVAGVRRLAFDDNNEFDIPEGQPLKQAQNEYYDFLEALYDPENNVDLDNEELGEKLDKYLEQLTPDKRDYIIANKSNFMIPDSIYQLTKSSGGVESRKAALRQKYEARGQAIPASLQKVGEDLYAVAQRVLESNEARARLSRNRQLQVPSPAEQIQLTETIATR
jgi:hypothetical protein